MNAIVIYISKIHSSYYTYDYSGERRLKLTGKSDRLDVNADFMHTGTPLDNPTLYPSAYLVLTKNEYTKHYYAGADRVAACLGGGEMDLAMTRDDDSYTSSLDPKAVQKVSTVLFEQSMRQVGGRVLEPNDLSCIQEIFQGEFEDVLHNPIDGIPNRMRARVGFKYYDFHKKVEELRHYQHDEGKYVYYYHSDHLGSASWITNHNGDAVQHLQYLPYGEPYVDKRTSGYSERFRFTGKERDEETGFGYFGARYMDHELMTMWLSVDPMADKYPSISPYAYCAWNPVRLVDPDGRDVWSLSDDGTMTWERSSPYDIIKYDKKEISLKNSNNVFGTGSEGYSFSLKDNQYYTFSDVMDAQKAFEFFADNLDFEFSALGYKEDGKRKYDLSTSLSKEGDANGSARADELGDKLRKHFHNHPNDIGDPSEPGNAKGIGNDKDFFDHIRQKSNSCEFYLYINEGGGGYRSYSFEKGKMNVSDARQSSFIKDSKNYTRKSGAIWHAFSF